ncbi:hypothetical protein OCU04_002021 [Sclerotinia nivalis]|uniref:Uncharacterized protein n=1 Tax=Sclerotinia nivalis TaxID=352851 RepID=A0A9X0AZA9_9HELO|nr:hypothetical protein OCU04_002021 [Sclerotinia nivalis]
MDGKESQWRRRHDDDDDDDEQKQREMEAEDDEIRQRQRLIDNIEERIAADHTVNTTLVNEIRSIKQQHEDNLRKVDASYKEYVQSRKNTEAVQRDILCYSREQLTLIVCKSVYIE